MSTIIEMFSYGFIARAVLVGIMVSLCASLLGVSLVLKRYAMIGDGLSHVGFGTLTIAVVLGFSPLYFSIPIVIVAAILLLKLNNNSKIKSDSAIALVGSSALALGVAVTSLTTGLNTDVCSYMFGSILAMSMADVWLSVIVSIFVIILYVLYYRKLFIVTFDEEFAKASGLKVNRYTNLISILTAITIVIGMRIMGTMLISSIVIFPTLTSMRIFKSFRNVVISSAIISVLCFFIGILISYLYNVSTGACVVIVNLILFIIFWIIAKIFKI